MAIVLRVKSTSTDGVLVEQQNLLGGALSSLTNLQVDTNFTQLNKAIKDEQTRAETAETTETTRALTAEATKVNLTGGNTISGTQNFTGIVTATTQSPNSNNTVVATTAYADAGDALKVNLAGGNTISGVQAFTGNVSFGSTTSLIGPTYSNGLNPPTDNIATGQYVQEYLRNIWWNNSNVQAASYTNPYIAPLHPPIPTVSPGATGQIITYNGLDLGRPGYEFANIYVQSGVFASNTVTIGTAPLKGSTEGGIVLPSNTAIGAADNVIPNNLASTVLDSSFAKTTNSATLKIPLFLVNSTIATIPSPVALTQNGQIRLLNQNNIDSGFITADRFVGFVTDLHDGSSNINMDVTVSGIVPGFSNLDHGAAISTVATVTPQINENDAITVSDGTNTVTVSAPGLENKWANALAIKQAIDTAATSAFKFDITENSGVLTFTAKAPALLAAPVLTQVTQTVPAIAGVYATYTAAITNSEAAALANTFSVSDGTNTVTISDFTSITSVDTLVTVIEAASGSPSDLLFSLTSDSNGIVITYDSFGPQSTAPILTGLTIVAGTTGVSPVAGVAAITTTPAFTTTAVGRPDNTLVEQFLNTDGTLTTVTSATNVKIGIAKSATELFLYSTSTVDTYALSQQKIEYTDLSVASNATPSGEGALAYNNTSGQFTFTPPKSISNATLTGVPTAPTALAATNSTQVANTAFVKTAIDNLIANSPEALDTLNELATAINNDATFATTLLNTINTGLALKAPINNPVFTGTLTAPTPVNSSNDTTVATTAFVKNTTPPLNNAALTGVPTTPTPSAGDNSTKIANTEFVFTAVAQGGGGVNIDGGTATSIRNTTTISLDGGGAI